MVVKQLKKRLNKLTSDILTFITEKLENRYEKKCLLGDDWFYDQNDDKVVEVYINSETKLLEYVTSDGYVEPVRNSLTIDDLICIAEILEYSDEQEYEGF